MDQLGPGDPQRLGAYRLIARLGAGGMGRVYLARSERGRTVAVKLVREELAAQEEFRARFRQEVRAARRVGGYWTAPVLDADTEAAVPWVATGYVAGPSLQQAVGHDYGALPERSVRILAAGLAHALGDIHAAGIVHRDLKPSNVLVTLDGPRVIDFGIARAMETIAESGLTRTGALVGSPGFMAPEQVRGDRITPACDVFCLGSVLAYAATGRLPFGAGGSGVHAQMFRIAQEEPDLEGMPEDIADLVRECLRKDPGARPSLARILERTGAEDTVTDGRSRDPWLPSALVAQLGRHAVVLLETENPPSEDEPPAPTLTQQPPAPAPAERPSPDPTLPNHPAPGTDGPPPRLGGPGPARGVTGAAGAGGQGPGLPVPGDAGAGGPDSGWAVPRDVGAGGQGPGLPVAGESGAGGQGPTHPAPGHSVPGPGGPVHPAPGHPGPGHDAPTLPASALPAPGHPGADPRARTYPALRKPGPDNPAPPHPAPVHPVSGSPASGHPASASPAAGHPAPAHPASGPPASVPPALTHPASGPAPARPAAPPHPASGQPDPVHSGPGRPASPHPAYGHPPPGHQPSPHQPPAYQPSAHPPLPPSYSTPPYGPPPVEPRRASRRSTALLLAVALVVAVAAGGSVYALMDGVEDGGAEGSGGTPTPRVSGSLTPGPSVEDPSPTTSQAPGGTIPADYLGTWSTTLDNDAGHHTRRLTLQQGGVGDTVLSLVADGADYHCVFQAKLAQEPTAQGTLAIGPSTVTVGEPASSCTPGAATQLTLLGDGSLERLNPGTGEKLTYIKE
ncbi:protein kinase [Streptomyces sp. NPDC057806]|uniref:serine/threonine-protein kinase n=1 Tax=Streptomyces sp. NPDC057806 TaxID=3346255 RepID=UPI00367CD155